MPTDKVDSMAEMKSDLISRLGLGDIGLMNKGIFALRFALYRLVEGEPSLLLEQGLVPGGYLHGQELDHVSGCFKHMHRAGHVRQEECRNTNIVYTAKTKDGFVAVVEIKPIEFVHHNMDEYARQLIDGLTTIATFAN